MESGWLIPYHSGKRDGISRQCRDISHLPTVEGCMKDGKTQCEQPNALNILIQIVRLIAPSVASRVSKQLTSFHHHSTQSLSLRKRVLSNPSRPASSDAFATNGSNSCASQDVLFSNSYTRHNSFRSISFLDILLHSCSITERISSTAFIRARLHNSQLRGSPLFSNSYIS